MFYCINLTFHLKHLCLPSDGLHCAHPGLCFCLPSWGAANLQRAKRVSELLHFQSRVPSHTHKKKTPLKRLSQVYYTPLNLVQKDKKVVFMTAEMQLKQRFIFTGTFWTFLICSDLYKRGCVWVFFFFFFFCSRSRKKMQNVSNLSILAMLIMYMMSALFGYLTFYGKKTHTPLSFIYYTIIMSVLLNGQNSKAWGEQR